MKTRFVQAIAVIALAFPGEARAQSPASAPVFDPFATFSLSRFTYNTLGFLQVQPTSSVGVLPATGTSSPTIGGGAEDELPLAVVPRPPYRPPVRSPYRPPPRPPF